MSKINGTTGCQLLTAQFIYKNTQAKLELNRCLEQAKTSIIDTRFAKFCGKSIQNEFQFHTV